MNMRASSGGQRNFTDHCRSITLTATTPDQAKFLAEVAAVFVDGGEIRARSRGKRNWWKFIAVGLVDNMTSLRK